MKRNIGYLALVVCVIFVTFFGLGPAIFADGSTKERIFTISIVLILYVILAVCFEMLRRHGKRPTK